MDHLKTNLITKTITKVATYTKNFTSEHIRKYVRKNKGLCTRIHGCKKIRNYRIQIQRQNSETRSFRTQICGCKRNQVLGPRIYECKKNQGSGTETR